MAGSNLPPQKREMEAFEVIDVEQKPQWGRCGDEEPGG